MADSDAHHDPHAGLHRDLVDTLDRLLALLRQLPGSGALSPTAAGVLSRLTSEGSIRLSELAALEGLSQPAMTQLVTRLEQACLVTRSPGPADRRVVLVHVTGAGRRLVAERKRERAAALVRGLQRLDPREVHAIAASLPALARLLELGFAPDRNDDSGSPP